MYTEQAKVQCDGCGAWIPVQRAEATVTCDCGQRFVVTITPLPARKA